MTPKTTATAARHSQGCAKALPHDRLPLPVLFSLALLSTRIFILKI
jgi:hypothetical protein